MFGMAAQWSAGVTCYIMIDFKQLDKQNKFKNEKNHKIQKTEVQ